MASILATLTARAGQEEQLGSILRKLVAATSAEPGVLSYDLTSPEDNAAVFIVAEHYRDAAARAAHVASPYLKAALKDAEPLLAKKPDIILLRSLASVRREPTPPAGVQA